MDIFEPTDDEIREHVLQNSEMYHNVPPDYVLCGVYPEIRIKLKREKMLALLNELAAPATPAEMGIICLLESLIKEVVR